MAHNSIQKYSNILSLLAFSGFFVSVKAEGSSGAAVWWMLFSVVAISSASAYLVYLQYFQNQPLGKHHPDFEEIVDPELGRGKSRNERKREEEVKERHMNDDDKRKQLERNVRKDVNKPVHSERHDRNDRNMARPEHVRT